MSQATAPRAERVTHATVEDVALPRGGMLALVTLDNDLPAPTTIGPRGLGELADTLATLRARAGNGELAAVAVTGKPGVFAAGADLGLVARVGSRQAALELARAGHATYDLLRDVGVPTFAFVNGTALGGGLELALACDYRVAAADARALGLPETGLGLVPGWGGAYRLPRLVGIQAAIDLVVTRAAGNRPLAAADAERVGLVDAVLDPEGFVPAAVRWAAAVLSGNLVVARRPLDDEATWADAVAAARERLDATIHGSRAAPYRALDLLAAARDAEPAAAFAAEDEALVELIMTDEMRAAAYAFVLVTRARRPAGAPDPALSHPVARVGLVGAGLMAAQIAGLAASRLRVPVVMRDVDDAHVAAGLATVASGVRRAVSAGRLLPDEGDRIVAAVSGSTDVGAFAGCDLVVEAVTEDLDVKRAAFAEIEAVVGPGAVLATNTSALSVTAMADGLRHPGRVVGLHFFNPVAAMPLVEVVHGARTAPEALATAFDVAALLGKSAVGVSDRPGFVVNRLLVLLLGVVLGCVERGTPVEVADRALDPLGLPMAPFELLELVGPVVGLHVLESLRADLGDRFPESPGLRALAGRRTPLVLTAAPGLPRAVDPAIQAAFAAAPGTGPDEDAVRDAVLTALATEVGLMLDEGVVAMPQQIDTCLILGAGWPFHLGGICPYLDRSGYSQRVLGRRLLADGVANVPAA